MRLNSKLVRATLTRARDLGEVFPTSARAKGQGVGSASHWFMNALIAQIFPVVVNKMSTATPLVFFAAVTAVQFFVPRLRIETWGTRPPPARRMRRLTPTRWPECLR
jgi:hypothetical protein